MPTDPRSGRSYSKIRSEFVARARAINAPCWLCAGTLGPIDYTAKHGSWNSPQLDHRYPISTHPHLIREPSNFRIAHATCNQARGTKDPTLMHTATMHNAMHKNESARINDWTPTAW